MLHRYPLFPVLLTYFLDTFGLAIVYPIFTPLLLSSTAGFVQPEASVLERTILLGFLVSAFPFAQFFGSPLLGELSDRKGRKKILIFSIFGTAIGYAISAVAILANHLIILFLGRIWTGLFAGNLTICLASIADMSHNEHLRARNFGFVGACGGLSFLLAIMMGGTLSLFSPSIPFWITSGLSFINLLSVYFLFQETHPPKADEKLNLVRGIQDLKQALTTKHLKNVYFIYFFFMAAWSTSMQFLPTMLIEHFKSPPIAITYILVATGVVWSVMNLFINRIMAKKFMPPQTLKISLFFLAGFLFSTLFVESFSWFFVLFICAACFGALAWTNSIATVSIKAPLKIQGSILGINQSVGALAVIFGPSFGGVLAGFNPHLVFLFSSLASLAGAILLIKERQKA